MPTEKCKMCLEVLKPCICGSFGLTSEEKEFQKKGDLRMVPAWQGKCDLETWKRKLTRIIALALKRRLSLFMKLISEN